MSKMTLAFGSFVAGILLGSVFFGSHTVTFAQPLPPAAPQFTDITVKAGPNGKGVEMGKEPTIPGLGPKFVRSHVDEGRNP